MESKKRQLVSTMKEKQRPPEQAGGCWWGGAEGRYKTGGVGGTSYWV